MLKRLTAVVLAATGMAVFGQRVHAAGKDLSLVPSAGELAHRSVYTGSYALIVGINDYPNLPAQLQLHFAVADAMSVRDMLIANYGFPPDHVKMLLNGNATRQNIDDAISDFADQEKYHNDDRILVYFSGHGQTVSLPGGGEMGFLIPSNAKVDLGHIENAAPYLRSCIEMEQVWDYLQSTPAKHVLLIADACYSGLLTQTRALGITPGALAAMASRRALQVMTAGGKGETSMELDQYGHGAFTYKLLEELKAHAAEGPGNVFTSSELYATVERSVSNLTNGGQDPQFGNYKTEGNFLFITTKPQPVPMLSEVAQNDNTTAPEPETHSTDDSVEPAPTPQPEPKRTPKPAAHAQKGKASKPSARAYNAAALQQLYQSLSELASPDPSAEQNSKMTAAIKAALDNGADPNGLVSEGGDPEPVLIAAISYESLTAVKMLLDYGANPNCRRASDGETPLHLSGEEGHFADDILIAHGAH